MRQESTVRIYGEMISHIVPLNIHQIAEYLLHLLPELSNGTQGTAASTRGKQAARKDAAANR
jgi:hypothetical protein